MLVSDIIAAAKQYTQIDGSSWFPDVDALRSVNRAYRDVYEKILDANDEYFIKEVTVLVSAMTKVRDNLYEYTLPSDWYRLRQLNAVIPTGEHQFERLDPLAINQHEGYRYFNSKLRLTFRNPYDSFRIEYYPTPAEYTALNQNINYPPQLEPLIVAYQIAMDITKAQKGDPTPHAEEYARLWNRFEHAAKRRDNLRYTKISNQYRSTFPGW
jgi:hypothetical protein